MGVTLPGVDAGSAKEFCFALLAAAVTARRPAARQLPPSPMLRAAALTRRAGCSGARLGRTQEETLEPAMVAVAIKCAGLQPNVTDPLLSDIIWWAPARCAGLPAPRRRAA